MESNGVKFPFKVKFELDSVGKASRLTSAKPSKPGRLATTPTACLPRWRLAFLGKAGRFAYLSNEAFLKKSLHGLRDARFVVRAGYPVGHRFHCFRRVPHCDT